MKFSNNITYIRKFTNHKKKSILVSFFLKYVHQIYPAKSLVKNMPQNEQEFSPKCLFLTFSEKKS